MPEWLSTSIGNSPEIPSMVLAWRIGVALILGVAVAGLYRWARRNESPQPTFMVTLVLLATLIAMATQIIGDNVARAFSLVGALSVVRFRTVVKDTQDTAFVIFAVVVGMASGTNHLAVGLVGLMVLGVASLALWPSHRAGGWQGHVSTLSLRIGLGDGIQASVEGILRSAAEQYELISVGTARQGASLDLVYRTRLRPESSPSHIVSDLNSLDGVESVDLRRGD